jgi:hypothetical protein
MLRGEEMKGSVLDIASPLIINIYAGYSQKNGAVSEINKKPISNLTGVKRTSSAATIVQVCHVLPAVRFSCLLRFRGAISATSSSKPCTNLRLHCNHRSGHLKMEHTESLFLLRRHLGNWPRGPAVSMRSELLVAHEKRGQLPLLTVYIDFLLTFETAPFFCECTVYILIAPSTHILLLMIYRHCSSNV